LALLLVAAHRDPLDPRLEGVAARLLAIDSAIGRSNYANPQHGFVLGAPFCDQRMHTWQRLVQATLAGLRPDATLPALAEVIGRLKPERAG
jgi:hypothetical protein